MPKIVKSPILVALVVLTALTVAKPVRPERNRSKGTVPAWLQQELKPIVNKPVVTR